MASASTMYMTAAYDEHKEWLKTLHSAHAAHMSRTEMQPSPLPSAPMMWARPEEMNEVPSGFGGLAGFESAFDRSFASSFANVALSDDDFDAPVYRSLGGVIGAEAMGSLDLAIEEESPRYRGGDFAPVAAAPQAMSAEDADRAWLESMPPLIRRQNARVAAFTIP